MDTARQMSLPGIDYRPHFPTVARHKLPTNITANRYAVHRWFNFVAGFAPEFVAQHCPDTVGGLLLDPFCGCGTALVTAQALGHRAVGFEPHPFFARITKAKIDTHPKISRLKSIEMILLKGIQSPKSADSLPDSAAVFLAKLFDEPVLMQLLGARAALESEKMEGDNIAFLVLSRVLDMCSKSKTDGIYKAPSSTRKAAVPRNAICEVIEEIQRDADSIARIDEFATAILHPVSSENMNLVKPSCIDVVVTSPPYLNNFDFAEMTRMYLYFWGICGSWQEITREVRSKLIVNTTTALAGYREHQSKYRSEVVTPLLAQLDALVGDLAHKRTVRAGKKEYDLLIYPYFAQMTRVLRETLRRLRITGEMHMIIADSAFYGTHVNTPKLLAVTMSELGYRSVKCTKLRERGQRWILKKRDGSSTGLGEYHISAIRSQEI